MRLVVLDGSAAKSEFLVVEPNAVIGRAPDCEVRLEDPEASRYHARCSLVDGRYVIRDIEAANPTVVNDRVLEGERVLENGDLIVIGGVLLQVQEAAATVRQPPAELSGTPATIALIERPSTPVEPARAISARLSAGAARLDPARLPPPSASSHGIEARLGELARRLAAIEANHRTIGGNDEIVRLQALVGNRRQNQTDFRALNAIADDAAALGRAIRVTRGAFRTLVEVEEVLGR